MIFQDPMTLAESDDDDRRSDRRNAASCIAGYSDRQAHDRAVELLDATQHSRTRRKRAPQYPFEFSGGMLQRSMIAMAIACEPQVLIADEPTTALDVTIQAQILDLLKDLQRETGMAIMLITHDLGVVARMADERRRHVCGRDRRARHRRRLFYRVGAPVHARLARRDAEQRRTAREPACGRSKAAPPDLFAPPLGLRLLRALPVRDARSASSDHPPPFAPRRRPSRRAAGCNHDDAHRSVERLHAMPRASRVPS